MLRAAQSFSRSSNQSGNMRSRQFFLNHKAKLSISLKPWTKHYHREADPQKLDDGWPESVEEQGLLLLVWRHHIRNNILTMCSRQSRRGILTQNSEKCKTIVCIANTFTHRSFYTQKLLHTKAFTHRNFYRQTAFTHKGFHTQKLLQTDTFTHRSFYTQTLLHTTAFTHRSFYPQKLLQTEAFTHIRFYPQKLLHTDSLYTHTLLHRCFYTQTLLHTDTFTHRHF